MDGDTAASLQSVLAGIAAGERLPGIQVSVRDQAGATWFGVAAGPRGDRSPISLESEVRIASVTKLYTAILVMEAVDRGEISLDDRLATWLPDYPHAASILIRMLLSHTAGVAEPLRAPGVLFRSGLFTGTRWSDEELIELLIHAKPTGDPGERFSYSNGGYMLLGIVLERVTGLPYGALVEERIARPLALRHTYAIPYREAGDLLVSGFDRSLMPYHNWHRPRHTGWASLAAGSGALVSRTDEMLIVIDALFDGTLVSADSLQQMMQTVPTEGELRDEIDAYGLGLTHLVIDGIEYWGHEGLFIGFQGMLVHAPAIDLSIAVVANVSSFDVVRAVRDIAAAAVPR